MSKTIKSCCKPVHVIWQLCKFQLSRNATVYLYTMHLDIIPLDINAL